MMLETIRQYALRRLDDDDERDVVRRWHCDYYKRLVEQNVARLSTSDEQPALAVLGADIGNVRGALQWAIEAAPSTGLRLAGQLGEYWSIRSDPDGLQWLDGALRAAGERAPLIDRARAIVWLADQFDLRNEGDATIATLREALGLFQEADDHAGISRPCAGLLSRSERSPTTVSGNGNAPARPVDTHGSRATTRCSGWR